MLINIIFEGLILFCLSAFFFNIYPNISRLIDINTKPQTVDVTQSSKPTGSGIIFPLLFLIFFTLNFQNFYTDINFYTFFILSISCFCMAILGFFDDIYSLSSNLKLFFQIAFVGLIAIFFINDLLNFDNFIDYLLLFIIFLSGVWLLNVFNFIDGADGLLAINSIIIAMAIGIYCFLENQIFLTLALFNLVLILSAFLAFNWHPSKILMGDSGSLFLGSLFLILIFYLISQQILNLTTIFIVFSLMIVETSCTLFVRIFRKENFLSGRHDLHAYQQLAKRPGGGSLPAKISVVIAVFWLAPLSALSYIYEEFWLEILLIDVIPLSLLCYIYGPYISLKEKNERLSG